MDISLRALRYFVATAEAGKISEAAVRLNISQPSVSAAIHQIEEKFGLQLFLRLPAKGIQLTSDGARFLERARYLLAQAEEFQHDASAISQGIDGEITVASFVNLSPTIMAELLGIFREKYPMVRVNFHDANQHDIISGLMTGQIEIAVTFDLALQSGFSSSVLATLQPRAVLSPDDPLALERSISLHDLCTRPFVLMDLPHTRDYFHSLFSDQRIAPAIAYRCISFEAVRSFVASGLGVSLLNISPATDVALCGRPVVLRPITEAVRPLRIVLLRSKRLKMRPALNVFQEVATQVLPALAGPL